MSYSNGDWEEIVADGQRRLPDEQHSPAWRFWVLWVSASVIGTIAGQIAARLAVRGVVGAVGWALEGAVHGALTGTLQWLVLRKRIPHTGFWVLASTLGWAVGTAVGWTLRWDVPDHVTWGQVVGVGGSVFGPDYGALVGAVVGTVVGTVVGALQWGVLREKLPRAGLWVPASILGWAVGTAVDTLVPALGTGAGIITGGAMVWLLRQRGVSGGARTRPATPTSCRAAGVQETSTPESTTGEPALAWRAAARFAGAKPGSLLGSQSGTCAP